MPRSIVLPAGYPRIWAMTRWEDEHGTFCSRNFANLRLLKTTLLLSAIVNEHYSSISARSITWKSLGWR